MTEFLFWTCLSVVFVSITIVSALAVAYLAIVIGRDIRNEWRKS
jgi:hypothetical protein